MAAEFPKHPFLLSVQEVKQATGTDVDKGLTSAQVAELQQKYPPNELDVGGGIAWYTIFIRQLCNAMILVCLFELPVANWPFLPHVMEAWEDGDMLNAKYSSRSFSSPWP
jgi:Na+-exporting ATPase